MVVWPGPFFLKKKKENMYKYNHINPYQREYLVRVVVLDVTPVHIQDFVESARGVQAEDKGAFLCFFRRRRRRRLR